MSTTLRAAMTIFVLTIVFASAPIAFAATEIQGSLRSDGSTSTPMNRDVDTSMTGETQGENSISGTVVGGVDDDSGMAAFGGSTQNGALQGFMWMLIPLAILALAGAGFYTVTRRA